MAAHISRRLRKGAATTALAAVAMAALTASQAPGFAGEHSENTRDRDRDVAGEAPSSADDAISGDSSYHTDLPPLRSPKHPTRPGDRPSGANEPTGVGGADSGIPATVLDAYRKAESSVAVSRAQCQLPWQLLAAIGRVESGQARGGAVDREGTTYSPILGPVLDGNGFARITDTDGGAYDGDTTHDRAVGPMQFIPSTWATWRQDGNGDGVRNPNNIYDAALAAAHYLCANDRDLSVKADLDKAILGYNRSQEYLRTVLSWLEYYRSGTHEVPDGTGALPADDGPGTRGDQRPDDNGDPARKPGGHKGHSADKGGKEQAQRPGGTERPDKPQRPEPPHKPGQPNKPTPPPTPPTKPTPPTTPPPTTSPAPKLEKSLTRVGAQEFTATEGTSFDASPEVRVVDGKGKPLPAVRVRYEIHGETEARFYGLTDQVTVFSRLDGTAKAPKIMAGKKVGTFTVRATLVDGPKGAVDFTGTVTPRPAPTPTADADRHAAAHREAGRLVRRADHDAGHPPGEAGRGREVHRDHDHLGH